LSGAVCHVSSVAPRFLHSSTQNSINFSAAPVPRAAGETNRSFITPIRDAMNDMFVSPAARGTGAAEKLIEFCVEECRKRGATELTWQTAPDNERAQRVYDRVGATRSQWVDYSLSVRK